MRLNRKSIVQIFTFFMLAFASITIVSAETIGVFCDNSIPQIKFASEDLKKALESKGFTVEMNPLTALKAKYQNRKVVIALASNEKISKQLIAAGGNVPSDLGEQAYCLRTTTSKKMSYWVLGGDVNGAMYGVFKIAENIETSGFSDTYNNQEAPFLLNRGMKLNMPLDRRIPTYVGNWKSNSTTKAIPHVWDITFWQKLIDQQARFRYNVLSVWVHHPFPALVKLADYPKASLPNIEGFDGFVKELNHEQRVAFWREVMKYAHDRGIKFYFFNWNVYLDYAKEQYPILTEDGNNAATKDYTYKSLYALMETYPELDGFGISAGDGMMGQPGFNNDSKIKTQWTYDVFGKAVKDYLTANPNRKFNLIHRGIGSSPELLNEKFAPLKEVKNATVNFSHKYAQAHMYSTPTPQWTNSVHDASKLGLKSWLTIRNDDYFYINWGDPKFVRDYMAGIPEKQSIVGMYIGSDGYTPSCTYFCKDETMNGQLEVERRWYMEMLWGRISYNPETSDDVFKQMLAKRFPGVSAENLFQAWSLASRSLPKATEMIMKKWSLDFHWYPEACWSDPGRCSGFRTIDGFANETSVANGSKLCDIANSAAGTCDGKKSSYTVADEMQADSEKALSLVGTIHANGNADLEMAIKNIEQMSYLGLYYAYKIRGATYKKAGKIELAREIMAKAYCCWYKYSRTMEQTYKPDNFREVQLPNWQFGDSIVLKEYTDLGGIGAPICGDKSFKVTLSSSNDAHGTTTGAGSYNPGDNVAITALPKAGYRFLCWTENNVMVSSDISYLFELNSDKQLTAHFLEIGKCGFPWNDKGLKINNETVNKTIGPIDISCAQNGVNILVNIEGVGTDDSDYCKLYYKVDGADQKPIAELKGKFNLKTVSVLNIKGKKLEILVSSATSFSDEFFHIKNITVIE